MSKDTFSAVLVITRTLDCPTIYTKFSIDSYGRVEFVLLSVDGEYPSKRCGSAMTVANIDGLDYLYVVGGGYRIGFVMDVWRICISFEDLVWEPISNIVSQNDFFSKILNVEISNCRFSLLS